MTASSNRNQSTSKAKYFKSDDKYKNIMKITKLSKITSKTEFILNSVFIMLVTIELWYKLFRYMFCIAKLGGGNERNST